MIKHVKLLLDKASADLNRSGALIDKARDHAFDWIVDLAQAALIAILAWYMAKWAAVALKRLIDRLRPHHDDRTLSQFLSQVVRWVILILGAAWVLQRLGVQMASIVAVLGAASLAVGLALQGALGNIAAGVMLLVVKAYRVGDMVKFGDITGHVTRLSLFTTNIQTPENLKVVVPNSKVFGDAVTNFTALGKRRVEIVVGVHYQTNLEAALDQLLQVAKAHPEVLSEPAPFAGATGFADSSIALVLHAFVPADRGPFVRSDLILAIKASFAEAGIVIPYPHQVQVKDLWSAE